MLTCPTPPVAPNPVTGTVVSPTALTMPTRPKTLKLPAVTETPEPCVTVTEPTEAVAPRPVAVTMASPSIVTEPTVPVAATPVALTLASAFTVTAPTAVSYTHLTLPTT